MTGLNVLSSTALNGSIGSESSPSPKKGTGSSDDSVSAVFMAILGGWMFPVDGSKGQDYEEKKSGDEKQQSPQDSLGTMTVSNVLGVQELGLQKVLAGLFELSQAESILQSNFPAGKEANSGGAVNQGNNIPIDLTNVSVGNKPLESAMTLQRTGMMPQMSVGDFSPILSELDEYKNIVSGLLKELSGEVRVVSPSSNEDGLKANGSDLKGNILGGQNQKPLGTLSKSTLDWIKTNMSTVMKTLSVMDEQSSSNTSKQQIGANTTQVQEITINKGLDTGEQETPAIKGLNAEVKSTLNKPIVQVNSGEQLSSFFSTSNRDEEKSVVTQLKTNAVSTDEERLVSSLQNDKSVLVGLNQNTSKKQIGVDTTQVQETPVIKGLNAEVKSTLNKPIVQINVGEQGSTSNRDEEKSVVTQLKTNAVSTDEERLVSSLQNDKSVLVGQNQNTSKEQIGGSTTLVQETPLNKGLDMGKQETLSIKGLNAEEKSTLNKPTVQVNVGEQSSFSNRDGEKSVTPLQNKNLLDTNSNSTELNNNSQIVEVNNRNHKGVQNQDLSQNASDLTKSINSIITVGQQSLVIGDDLSKGSFAGNNKEQGQPHSHISSDETVTDDGQVVTDSKFNLSNLSSLMPKEKSQPILLNTDSKAVTSPVWEQISASMQRHLVAQHPEIKELEIQLHPADLGKIQLSIRWENGQVHLQCQASEASTTSILQQNLAQLRESLQNSGISCGMLQMGLGGQQQQRPKNEFNTYKQSNEKEVKEENGQPRLREVAYSVNGHLTDHLINITA